MRSEVSVASDEGLPSPSVVHCDNLVTVPKLSFVAQPAGSLGVEQRAGLDRAQRDALDIQVGWRGCRAERPVAGRQPDSPTDRRGAGSGGGREPQRDGTPDDRRSGPTSS